MGDVRIARAGAERLDDLAPLWTALHEHHREVADEIPGIAMRQVPDAWDRRRARYVEWLAHPGAFVLIAEEDGTGPVGYALVSIHEGGDDTHVTRERWAELQSLALLPTSRGEGLGARMMEAVFAELRRLEIGELLIGVLSGNEGAFRFYERYGFRPWVVELLGRVPEA
ncbi:MAG: GNAT family N-acetyltransferase [Actinobacteria bacterium]|nr:GNAT family N-acetyltransferase [Actinomycetota bacterium]